MKEVIKELKDCLALAEDLKDDLPGLLIELEDKDGPIYSALYDKTLEEIEKPGN